MSRRRFFWILFGALVALLLIGVLGLLLFIHVTYNTFTLPGTASNPPSSPIGLTFLALVIAFSVYLRQVASGADEKQEKIRKGDVSLYPVGADHTNEKLAALNRTHENLIVVAPFLIWLSLFTTLRVCIDSLAPFGLIAGPHWALCLKVFDFALTEWLFITFITLGIFHLRASRRDEKTRAKALTALAKQNSHCADGGT